MSLGIGLGAFVDGFAKGYGLRQEKERLDEERADRAEDRAWRETQRQWATEDRQYQTRERERQQSDRDAIRQIQSEGRAEFQEQVEAGTFKPEEFDTFYTQYVLPKMEVELLNQGDYEGYQRLRDWGESEAAKKGSRLFAESLFLAQSGQHDKALDKVIEAGKVRGYIGDDYDIDEKEPIVDEDGNTLGYRITIRDGDGNETVQDIALDDIPNVIATFANPQAAWESQQATRVRNTERKEELEDFEAKERIKAGYSNDERTTAIKSLRDRMKADPLNPEAVAFDDLPREERERLIADEIAFTKGAQAGPTAPAPRVTVDSQTGQAVPVPDPAAADAAPGLGNVPTPAPRLTAPRQSSGPAANAPSATINGQVDKGIAAPPSNAQLVEQAASDMVAGKDPQEIARTLRAVGVDEAQWPAELQRVMTARPAP